MREFIKKKLAAAFILLLAVVMVTPYISAKATVKPQAYDVKINFGIAGNYKAMKYIPINVEINALEKDLNGEVEVRVPSDMSGLYDAYSSKVTVNKGESTTVIIPIKAGDGANKINVLLLENNKSVYESKVILSAGRISDGNLFVGLLTEDLTSLGYLGDVKYDMSKMGVGGGKLNTVKLDLNLFNNNNLNIDGLDLIIINNYNMANLKKEHYDALKAWISRGGKLIIGAGANEGKTVKIIDKDFLDIESKGNKLGAVNIEGESLNLALSELNIKDSTVKSSSTGKELVYSVKKDKGEILVATFDLGLEPFSSSEIAPTFIGNLISNKFEEFYGKYNYYGGYGYYGTQNLTNNIPIDSVVSPEVIGVIIGIYAVVIGFILYIVLKKINKREYTWIAIPLIAIMFSFIIYGAGSKTRVKDVILNQVNILNVNNDGVATIKGYLGIGTKYKSNIVIEKPQELNMNYLSNNNYYMPDNNNTTYNKLRVKTTYENNNSYFTFDNSEALNMKYFEVNGKEEVVNKLQGSFNLDGGNLNGTLINNLESDINKVLLIAGQNIWELGSVKRGEELKVEKLALTSSYGLQQYADKIMQDYNNAKWNNKSQLKTEKFRGISRYSNILGTVGSELVFVDKAKVIAITDLPINYDIKFDNKSVSKFNTTAIIQDIEIDFKDKEGNINFPEGYFKATVNTSSPNVHVDEYAGYIFGQGDIVFDYTIDKNINPLEVTVKPGTDMYGNQNGTTSDTFVYNFKTKNYDSISLFAGFHKLTDMNSYIENNTFRIKMEVNDNAKGSSLIPKIAVKGSEK